MIFDDVVLVYVPKIMEACKEEVKLKHNLDRSIPIDVIFRFNMTSIGKVHPKVVTLPSSSLEYR